VIYLGIDVGKSGAMAALDETGCPFDNGIFKLDATDHDIAEWLWMVCEWGDVRACIEKVHSSPQMGVVSAFSFGRSLGYLMGLLAAVKIPYDEVSPQKWQKAMGCLSKGDKNVTKGRAQQLWPRAKCTHAISDAMLIAEYCRLNKKTP